MTTIATSIATPPVLPRVRTSVQAPGAVLMVRPHHFTPNPDTAADNAFQSLDGRSPSMIADAAAEEVTRAGQALRAAGVTVHVVDDDRTDRPDSVFPNNWLSTHAGGHVAVYPMYAPSRRNERRWDVVEMLKRCYRVQDVVDYSGLEHDGVFLEGTGAMVLDHMTRVAYTARSHRADPVALERFCTNFGYEPMVFDALDEAGRPVYHTNVMMCVATEFALICSAMITDDRRRREVVDRLAGVGRDVVDLTHAQIRDFAGNAIELQGREERLLAMSSRAAAALTADQRATIERSCRILALDVPTIELAGGSVRCMLAGIHLDPRPGALPEWSA